MSLLALQRDLAASLRGEDDAVSAGVRVYQNNYRVSLIACLGEAFPRTGDWLGADAFEVAVIAHIKRVPPSSWTLDAYGRDFPDTLDQLYPDDREVAELARLELALAEAFVAADAAVLTRSEASALDWDRASLYLTPSLELLAAITNADAIWTALFNEALPPSTYELSEGAALLVWRQGDVPCFRRIDAVEEGALRLVVSGANFVELCETLVEAYGTDEGVSIAGSFLARWLNDGLLSTPSQRA